MTKASKRTHPIDRDGDGKPGGSLPGNKTAPFATAESDQGDDLADARTTPGDSPEKLDAINRETDEANAAARVRELRELVRSKFLYKSADGYSATYKAPFISEDTVKVWIEAGLAEDVPSAGHMGGIRSTPAARREMVHIAGAYRDDAAA